MMENVNWIQALAGGALIGLSATLFLLLNGRIAGISGLFNRLPGLRQGEWWPLLFLLGMMGGGALYEYVFAAQPTPRAATAPVVLLMAGLLAGFGARMGGGCTSGHGVCGLGRFSSRSLVAVLTFMATAVVTVWVVRHSGFL
jgi:uncharacterized protein